MKSATRTINPADIVFPSGEATPAPQPPIAGVTAAMDVDAIEHSIWLMLRDCGGANKNDRVIIAISALIEANVNTSRRIVSAAMCLGFDRGHAGAVLKASEGSDPCRHRWQRGADDIYRVHAAVAQPKRS